MDPQHDGDARMARQACRPGDVEIETFEFILLQSLAGQLRIIDAKQAYVPPAIPPVFEQRVLGRYRDLS